MVRDAGGAATACTFARSGATGLRVSLWQGTIDTVVSPANLPVLEGMFARVLSVGGGVTTTDRGAIRAVYRDPHGQPVLETWLVQGLGPRLERRRSARLPTRGRSGRRRPISCSTSSWGRASRAGPAAAARWAC